MRSISYLRFFVLQLFLTISTFNGAHAEPQIETLNLNFGVIPFDNGNLTNNGVFEANNYGRTNCTPNSFGWVPPICKYSAATNLTTMQGNSFESLSLRSAPGIKVLEIETNVLFAKNEAPPWASFYQLCINEGPDYTCVGAEESKPYHFYAQSGSSTGITSFDATAVPDLFAITSMKITYIRVPLQLSVGELSLIQSGSTVGDDGILNVLPNKDLRVDVPIKGNNLSPIDTRSTTVTLQVGSKTFFQNVRMSDVYWLRNYIASFKLNFKPEEVGIHTIAASINSEGSLYETDFSDNRKETQVRVSGSKLVIKENPQIGQVVYDADFDNDSVVDLVVHTTSLGTHDAPPLNQEDAL